MIHTDAATVFIAWATGSLAWLASVGRRREVVFGAAWVIRVGAILLTLCALAAAGFTGWVVGRDTPAFALLVVTIAALGSSIVNHRRFRAAACSSDAPADAATPTGDRLDAVAALSGVVAVVFGTVSSGGPLALALARALVAVVALGGLTFTLVFGHRLLAKPYLGRGPLEVATTALLVTWPLEIVVMLLPTGMASVLTGAVDDGYAGILGWMWAMCAVSTGVLLVFAEVILKDRDHAKVASATGMLYLSGLTGVGAVLISRAVLSG